jgi:hypothetical protein
VTEDRELAPEVERVHTLVARQGLLQAVNAVLPSCFGLDLGDNPQVEFSR